MKRSYYNLAALVILGTIALSGAASSLKAFDAEQAFAYLERQCAFGPRNPGSAGHAACRDWLADTLRGMEWEVFLQGFSAKDATSGDSYRCTNIIARMVGKEVGTATMLCAHWDTRPVADQDPNPANRSQPILGANDGASGVAVLLEIARQASLKPPPRTLIIAFWDAEDMGRATHPDEFTLGSKYWAEHQLPEPVAEAVLLDLVGDADLEFPVELFSDKGAPHLRRRLWAMAARLGLEAFQERPGPAVQDDHVRLIRAGIPAVDIIDFDYPYWHTLEDTPDKCSPQSLGQVGRLLMAYIYGE